MRLAVHRKEDDKMNEIKNYTEKVFEDHADIIFEEAENRLHAQKAVLVKLLS